MMGNVGTQIRKTVAKEGGYAVNVCKQLFASSPDIDGQLASLKKGTVSSQGYQIAQVS